MCESVKEQLPDFLQDEIVYCDILTQRNKQRSCLALLKNLNFYEFQNKAVASFIDLNGTCLAKVKQQILEYKGSRGKWKTVPKDNKTTNEVSSSQTIELLETEICFGKYIYQNFNIQKLFILIKCWDKLIVLQHARTECDELVLKAEYENVQAFKLVHGKIKFQTAIEIKFQNGRKLITDLHEDNQQHKTESSQKTLKQENFKQLLERIRSAKTELLVHKSLTQHEFARLKTIQTLGCSLLRSRKLEERVLLARCGDVWMRLTANDDVVIGVSLVNNASAEACTVLKNIKPIFIAHSTLSYTFRLYQLQQQFSELESVETFLQSENNVEPEASNWFAASTAQLVPESFAVLCIKLHLSEIISLLQTPFFIFFDLERDVGDTMNKKVSLFNQQVFIKNIDFSILLTQRARYEITFKNSALHQDFLAIAMASEETSIALTFKAEADLDKFEQLLREKFDFKKLHRDIKLTNDENSTTSMDDDDYVLPLDTSKEHSTKSKHFSARTLYYNQQSTSIWHGTLAVHCMADNNQSTGITTNWKFYTKTTEKSYFLFKLLFNELLLYKCNVEEIEFHVNKTPKSVEFENALRQELNYALKLGTESTCSSNDNAQLEDSIDRMLKLEMQTDLLANTLT